MICGVRVSDGVEASCGRNSHTLIKIRDHFASLSREPQIFHVYPQSGRAVCGAARLIVMQDATGTCDASGVLVFSIPIQMTVMRYQTATFGRCNKVFLKFQ